jgi:hypothetical protein
VTHRDFTKKERRKKMTEKEIIETLHSVRNALGDASTYGSSANEYAAEAECAAERAATAANEAMESADAALEELNEVLKAIEGEDVVFSSQREAIVEELRVTMRNEVVHEVVNELQKVMSNKVISVLLEKGKGGEE